MRYQVFASVDECHQERTAIDRIYMESKGTRGICGDIDHIKSKFDIMQKKSVSGGWQDGRCAIKILMGKLFEMALQDKHWVWHW